MALRHELPTHLGVEDRVLGALSARQALVLLGGMAGTYDGWRQLADLPFELRGGLAAGALLLTLALALLRPGGRWLEAWAVAGLRYAALPKTAVWRPRPAEPDRPAGPAWVPFAPRLAWGEAAGAAPGTEVPA